jgi:hypothetical protein
MPTCPQGAKESKGKTAQHSRRGSFPQAGAVCRGVNQGSIWSDCWPPENLAIDQTAFHHGSFHILFFSQMELMLSSIPVSSLFMTQMESGINTPFQKHLLLVDNNEIPLSHRGLYLQVPRCMTDEFL